jgi:hypothetical protein
VGWRRVIAVVGLSLFLPGAVSPAFGADDGIHYDPDTPSGQEYALPLEQARGDAGGSPDSGAGSAPPFGAGIEPGAPSGAQGPEAQGGGAGNDTGGTGDSSGRPSGQTRDSAPSAERSSAGSRPEIATDAVQKSAATTGLLIGALALAFAGAASLLARRVRARA